MGNNNWVGGTYISKYVHLTYTAGGPRSQLFAANVGAQVCDPGKGPPNWRAWARSGAKGITALAALESMDRRLSQWNLVEKPGRQANPRQALRSRAPFASL